MRERERERESFHKGFTDNGINIIHVRRPHILTMNFSLCLSTVLQKQQAHASSESVSHKVGVKHRVNAD